MTVENIMTRDVTCCGPDETLDRAAQIMWERDCGCVPVLSDGRVVGMITDRDCCMAAYTKGQPLSAIRVGDAMAREVRFCGPREGLATVEERMREYQIRRMPVIEDDGRLVGIVSLNDLALAAERGRGQTGFPTTAEIFDTLAVISHHRGRPQQLEAE